MCRINYTGVTETRIDNNVLVFSDYIIFIVTLILNTQVVRETTMTIEPMARVRHHFERSIEQYLQSYLFTTYHSTMQTTSRYIPHEAYPTTAYNQRMQQYTILWLRHFHDVPTNLHLVRRCCHSPKVDPARKFAIFTF
jgi:hypothetical protein